MTTGMLPSVCHASHKPIHHTSYTSGSHHPRLSVLPSCWLLTFAHGISLSLVYANFRHCQALSRISSEFRQFAHGMASRFCQFVQIPSFFQGTGGTYAAFSPVHLSAVCRHFWHCSLLPDSSMGANLPARCPAAARIIRRSHRRTDRHGGCYGTASVRDKRRFRNCYTGRGNDRSGADNGTHHYCPHSAHRARLHRRNGTSAACESSAEIPSEPTVTETVPAATEPAAAALELQPIEAQTLLGAQETWFKAYMDYRTITDTASRQYQLQQSAWTDDQGLRRLGEDYLVAMGTGWRKRGLRGTVSGDAGQRCAVYRHRWRCQGGLPH